MTLHTLERPPVRTRQDEAGVAERSLSLGPQDRARLHSPISSVRGHWQLLLEDREEGYRLSIAADLETQLRTLLG